MDDGVLTNFTPERWSRAEEVLSGAKSSGVSWAAAAKAADVTIAELRGWVRRSLERRPEDDPLIWSIAEFINGIEELQAGYLEDVAWRRAIEGEETPIISGGEVKDYYKKVDNGLLMKLLSARDPRYSNKPEVSVKLEDVSEVFRRLQAGHRVLEAQRVAEERKLIEGDFDRV